jgi:mono/diheme cytochrome c family protein
MLTLSSEKQDAAVATLLAMTADDYKLREAAVSGLAFREIAFLRRLLNDSTWEAKDAARADVFTDVARAVTRRDDPAEMLQLVELIGELPTERQWQQLALLEAIPAARKDAFGAAKAIPVAAKPVAIATLSASSSKSVRAGAEKIAALFEWPGKPTPPRPPVPPLTAKQRALFEIGREQFTKVCAQCHQPDGMGLEGKAPPLRGSPWLNGPPSRVIRIVLHGMRGPVEVDGKVWNLEMAALGSMTDEQIAGTLTFLRRSWGHEASPIEPEVVANIRDWTQARRDGWTVRELLEMK